jgi:hypothetical protein
MLHFDVAVSCNACPRVSVSYTASRRSASAPVTYSPAYSANVCTQLNNMQRYAAKAGPAAGQATTSCKLEATKQEMHTRKQYMAAPAMHVLVFLCHTLPAAALPLPRLRTPQHTQQQNSPD